MKNRHLIALLFLLVSFSGQALFASDNEEYATGLIEKGRDFLSVQPDSALFYAGLANAFAKEHKMPLREAESAQIMGQVYFWKGDQEAARNLFESARQTLEKAKASPDLIAESFLELAYLERQTQNYNAALELGLMVRGLYSGDDSLENHSVLHSRVLALQGSIFEDLGSYDLAIEYFSRSIDLCKENADTNGLSDMYSRIGNVHLLMGENELALSTYEDALALERIKGNRPGEMMSLCQMGLVELARGNHKAAHMAHLEALQIAREEGMNRGIADNQMFIGRICLEVGDIDSALYHFESAYEIWKEPGIKIRMGQTKLGIARAHLALGDKNRSLTAGNEAAQLAKEANDKETEVEALSLVSAIYEQRGEYRKSLAAQRKQEAVQMEIFNQEQASKNTEMRVRFEHQQAVSQLEMEKTKQDMDLAMQDEQLRQNNLVQSILIGIFVLVLFFVVLLIRSNRSNRRNNHLLKEKGQEILVKNKELNKIQAELQATNTNLENLVDERTDALKEAVDSLIEVNEELDTFIYRASHDLLGPIARLKGLSMLLRQSQNTNPDKYIGLIDSVSIYMDRVLRKLILVHDMRKPQQVKGKSSIPEIVQDIEPGLLEIPGIVSPQVHLDCQVSNDIPYPNELVRVVLENVIENACIFRHPDSDGNPEIYIKASLVDDNLVIETRDEGIGIPDEIRTKVFDIFFRGSERSKGNGLGLYLVRLATEAMGGEVQLESEVGAYTLVRITLPLSEKDLQDLRKPEPVLA